MNNRILGIDCGTATTGWSITDQLIGAEKSLDLVDYGIIETHKLSPEPDRLVDLGESISELIEQYKPNVLAIEELFFARNVTTALKVSQARGVVIFVANKAGMEVFNYKPNQIKQNVTGYGRATKKQIITMINQLFNLNQELKQDDAADAIAVAYTHHCNTRLNN